MSVYIVTARVAGVPTAGLSPAWLSLNKVTDGTAVSSPSTTAPIIAIGGGGYKVTYDPSLGELYGIIDFGASLADPNERYADIYLSADLAAVGLTPATPALTLTALHADAQWADVHAFTAGNFTCPAGSTTETVYRVVGGVAATTPQIVSTLTRVGGAVTARLRTT